LGYFIVFTLITDTTILFERKVCFQCRGTGYPDLWPSLSCREPLDVTKNFTFDVISGILAGLVQVVYTFEA